MIQYGGGTNSSAALLKEVFAHEKTKKKHSKSTLLHPRVPTTPRSSREARGASRAYPSTGILPIINGNTDFSSLRRSARRSNVDKLSLSNSMRSSLPSPAPFTLPNHGIGYGVPRDTHTPGRGAPPLPQHGIPPPYFRRSVTRQFWDDAVFIGCIPCLSMFVGKRAQ